MRFLWVLTLLAACASAPSRLTMPDIHPEAARPDAAPPAQAGAPRLVPYPGLDVSYVANGQGEVYFCRKHYYCWFDDNWFRADTLQGPWDFIEMKYVPGDLFRARGHLPVALERQARDERPLVELVGGRG